MAKFTDMDMLQDYEKDARMAATAYSMMETDIMDNTLRTIIHQILMAAIKAQQESADMIMKRGDRP